jgi:hypothetical protein
MMRPGEPPTKEAAENLFQNLFFNNDRYDLSDVGRMKFDSRIQHAKIKYILLHPSNKDTSKSIISKYLSIFKLLLAALDNVEKIERTGES